MRLFELRGDPVHGFVVEQDRPKERLLGFEVVRRDARRRLLARLGQREGRLVRHCPQDAPIRRANCLRTETLT
jgi:hypothetical protein